MFLGPPFWKRWFAYGVLLSADGQVDLQSYFRRRSFNCLPFDMVLPLYERNTYADEEHNLQLESPGDNLKRHTRSPLILFTVKRIPIP